MIGRECSFLFVGNGPYLNRGCEAILRGTVKILRHAFNKPSFVNANFDVTNPPYMPVEIDADIIHRPLGEAERWSVKWMTGQVLKRTCPPLSRSFYFGSLKKYIKETDAVLSIGGDNYTLDYGVPRHFLNLDMYIIRYKKPLIIWGASIGPFGSIPYLAEKIHRHLKDDITVIFVREKLSQQYLAKHGIVDNVHLMSDPAFLMDPEPVSHDRLGFEMAKGAIGLNISPLMAKHITGGDMKAWSELGTEIVHELKDRIGRQMILIPHVTSPHSNDHKFLRNVLSRYEGDKKDIYLLPDFLSAAETKWVISKLDCLIAARTHATIASFSSCVPTVSLAYSVKAYGINERLFGHTDYVISPKQLRAEEVAERTKAVLRDNENIRKHLKNVMPAIKKNALEAGLVLKKIIGG